MPRQLNHRFVGQLWNGKKIVEVIHDYTWVDRRSPSCWVIRCDDDSIYEINVLPTKVIDNG